MTYRQLLAAFEQAKIWEEALLDLKCEYPIEGSAEQKDNHQAAINTIERSLDSEIDE